MAQQTKTSSTIEGLKRELGVIDIAASVINITVGSGFFYYLPW